MLPLDSREIELRLELRFFTYSEEGLGELEGAVIEIEGTPYWLHRPVGLTEPATTVDILSHEPDIEAALHRLLRQLDLTEDDLPWRTPLQGKAGWKLLRLDDNANEVEMFRFHEEACAQWVRKHFEKKGHKQAYFVKREDPTS